MVKEFKIWGTIILAVFVVTNVFVSPAFAWAPPEPRHPDCAVPTVSRTVGKPGDIVTIGIEVAGVHENGLETFGLDIFYDSYDLQILDVEPGEIIVNPEINFSYTIDEANNRIAVSFSDATKGNELIKTNGEIAKIIAKIEPEAINGLSEVRLAEFIQKIYEGERVSTSSTAKLPSETGGVKIEDGVENLLKIDFETIKGEPGDVLEIPVTLSNLPRVTSLKFAIEYDPALLEIMSVEPGEIISDSELMDFYYEVDPYYCHINNSDFYGIVFSYQPKDLTEKKQILFDGEFAVITAKVKDEAKEDSLALLRFADPKLPGMNNNYIYYTSVSPYRIKLETKDGVKIGNRQIMGDLNGNGKIDSTDYYLLKTYILGITKEYMSENGEYVADLNSDGRIDSIDYTLLKRYVLGIIDKFPAR